MELESETLRRLDAGSQQSGQSPTQLAARLLDDGLRMAAHPGIVFRSGPAGRRPGVVGGPDVWEVVRVYRAVQPRAEDAVEQTAELTGLTRGQVEIAARYYAESMPKKLTRGFTVSMKQPASPWLRIPGLPGRNLEAAAR